MTLSGPLFDGGAVAALDEYARWAEAEVGQQAMADWHENMDTSFKFPTGYYESTVHMDSDAYGTLVHDDGLIYNYWLEGYGSRNSPVTRFPGYFSAERAATDAKAAIERLIDPIPQRFIEAMGGVSP